MYADENILKFNDGPGDVIFYHNETGILNIDLHNTNLDKDVDKDDPDTITLIRLFTWHIKFRKHKELKKS